MLSNEAECLTDTSLEMKARPLAFKVSALRPISKVGGNSAQLIYTDTVVIFEVQQTFESFVKWLVKLKFQSYIAIFGEQNLTLRGGAVRCEIEQQHVIPRYKHTVCYL